MQSRRAGFSLIEVVIVVVLMAVVLVPMLNAFRQPAVATRAQRELTVFGLRAAAVLNRICALEFGALQANQGDPVDLAALYGWPGGPDAGAAGEEDFVLDGVTVSPRVAISDASGGAGGLVKVTVTAGDVTLSTLKAEY